MKNSEFPEKAFETYINHLLLEEGFNLYIPSQAKEAKVAYDALINILKSKTGRIIPIALQYKIVSEYKVPTKAKNFKFDLHPNINKKTKIAKYNQHNILYKKNKSSKYFAAGYVVPHFVTYEALYENIKNDTLLENSYFIKPQHLISDNTYQYHYCTFDEKCALQHSSDPFNNEIISLKELLNQTDNFGRDYAKPIESFIAEFTDMLGGYNLDNVKEFSEESSRKVYPIIAYKLLH